MKAGVDPELATQWAARGIDLDQLRVDASGTIMPPTEIAPALPSPRTGNLVVEGDLESARTLAAEPQPQLPPSEPQPRRRSASVTEQGATLQRPDAATRSSSSLVTKLTSTLPLLADPVGGERQFEIGSTLGEGGMGIVRVAVQTALRRQVAVKSQRADHDDASTTLQLLREARATGALEHPNIVPVHALGRDERQRPLIVMKRIEGSSWSDVLREKPVSGSSDEALDLHLEILAQVARALQFAHSRGIVHLDVKPENVMVGSFGEVYLVDWGIAMRCRAADDPSGLKLEDLPLAKDLEHIVGTPNYLAPEMAMADGASIGEHTDVYLLGATLYEVVSGCVPHDGTSLREILERAYASPAREYPACVPSSLRAICDRAMARAIVDRFPSVQAFSEALADVKRHRSSLALSDVALKELATLRDRVRRWQESQARQPGVRTTRGRAGGAGGDAEDAERRAISDLFSACRFGFAHALNVWPDNEDAARGRREAYEIIVRFELDRGSAAGAAAYLVETPDMPDALVAKVKSAVKLERQRRDKLARFEKDEELESGDRLRSIVSLVTGVFWGGGHIAFAYLRRSGSVVTALQMLLFHCGLLVAIAFAAIAGRRVFWGNAGNARTSWFYVLWAVGYSACWLSAAVTNIPIESTARVGAMIGAFLWLTGTITADRRLWPLPAALGFGVIADLIVPGYTLEWIAFAAFIGPTIVGLMWRSGGPAAAAAAAAAADADAAARQRHDR